MLIKSTGRELQSHHHMGMAGVALALPPRPSSAHYALARDSVLGELLFIAKVEGVRTSRNPHSLLPTIVKHRKEEFHHSLEFLGGQG